MPELPEAETIARDLQRSIVGRTVKGVTVRHPDVLAPGLSPASLGSRLRGRRIERVGRRGKNVLLFFDGDAILAVNLGMTGRLVATTAPRAAELRHVAVRFELDDGHALLYDDARRFGRLELHTPETWRERNAALGVEPLSDEFTADRLYAMLRKSRSPVRNWLLNQRRLAGVGNIYANEALFRAGIRPSRRADRIGRERAAKLRDSLRDVLREAIAARGTTFSDYRDASGERGGFEPKLRVYGRESLPCPVCGTLIERIVLSNRSAFYCPHCQR
ncbi:MAG TPA: bifunctional DNA-formamidopyrimidine glycosylase/DNA-(apurinic or apyrimidinic site) lyase [Longimicrobiales bacterium]|nr:bifunctional DNA-formamidopyrimidine glycosylase/DNA-(apurinic or apyrimidinic site) lyase [Longimicrobiales bacterium]